MPRAARMLTRPFSCLMFIFLVAGYNHVSAQITGEWRATVKERETNEIQLSFERNDDKGRRNHSGSGFDYADLQGLTREQALRGGPVAFSLVREAGTIACEGSFQDGRGSGMFRLTVNRSFVAAMKSRGFDFEQTSSRPGRGPELEDRLFSAVILNVTTALADDLLSADFGRLGVDDLFKAAIFKVDSKFAREMRTSGFPNIGMEELVKARIFKIDADFVRAVVQMGFDKEPFESLVKMRIFKITPEFIAEARNEGLNDLSIEDLVKMRIFNINGEFIRQARASGVPVQIEPLVQKRIGVWGR